MGMPFGDVSGDTSMSARSRHPPRTCGYVMLTWDERAGSEALRATGAVLPLKPTTPCP